MLSKEITYIDYNGEERKETFYFNLSKAEVMEMQMEIDGGLDAYIKRIVASKDMKSVFILFKDIILKSYGVKSADGKRFIKSKEISDEFSQTEAYSILFMELATNVDYANTFMSGILPTDLKELEKK